MSALTMSPSPLRAYFLGRRGATKGSMGSSSKKSFVFVCLFAFVSKPAGGMILGSTVAVMPTSRRQVVHEGGTPGVRGEDDRRTRTGNDNNLACQTPHQDPGALFPSAAFTVEPAMFSGRGPREGTPRGSGVNGPLDALVRWAREQPEKTVYTFLDAKGNPVSSLTYAQLDAMTLRLASHLVAVANVTPGSCALLVYPPGLDFIVAFLACLRAGIIAVPVFPPDPTRLSKDLALFASTQARSGARVALTNHEYNYAKKLGYLQKLIRADGGRWPADLTWFVTNDVAAPATAPELPPPAPDAVAFLQFTSGSTSEPKGVRITHDNLAHNLAWIMHALAVDTSTVEVSWLPQYHDMGLIGAYLGLLCCGGTGYYMSPFTFIRAPLLWLKTISDYRGTHTQAPSFAYAFTAKRFAALSPDTRPALNLGTLRHAINGAEPVDLVAMDAFQAAFGPAGLRKGVVVPTYGLAEHTVFVSTGGQKVLVLDRARLEEKSEVVVAPRGASPAACYTAVGCGAPPPGAAIQVRIVHPESRAPLGSRRGSLAAIAGAGESTDVGEIWLASRSVADGYWVPATEGPEATAMRELSKETFGAEVSGEEGSGTHWLRTGDLGFLHGGELFVCGRAKDLIIVRGLNHYPQDIERTAERAVSELRPGCSAAFALSPGEALRAREAFARAGIRESAATGESPAEGEALVLVAELRKEAVNKAASVTARTAAAISSAHFVAPAVVILIKERTIFKTKSGKVSRSRVKKDLLGESGTPLAAVHAEWFSRSSTEQAGDEVDAGGHQETAPGGPGSSAGPNPSLAPVDVAALRRQPLDALAKDIGERIAFEMGLDPTALDHKRPLVELGAGSLELVQIRGMLQARCDHIRLVAR